LLVATILRGDGITGVDTHIRQLRDFLHNHGVDSTLVTPFSWGRALSYPVFAVRRLAPQRCSPASVAWYLHWHEAFLRAALRRRLARLDHCVVYAQDPLAARAALRVRRGPQQRVVMAVHLRTSMADEWAAKKQISRDGIVFRAIRRAERSAIPHVDALVYVSHWAREALTSWLPEAKAVPSEVIGNFVAAAPQTYREPVGDLVTIGNLDLVKNHRYLLQVMAEARRAGRTFTLDIFGDGPCRKDLVSQARALGLERNVRLRGFRTDVRDFLPGYRAYVHASYSESSSLAIMEAMQAGLPIVAGDTGPISELCDDGAEARFWPLDNPRTAAAVLVGLFDSEPSRRAAARAARERFHRDFDAEVVGPRLYAFLLGTGAQAPAVCSASSD
jgi:glycosyltransferase involved in cell wall biosynthesis